MEIVYSQKIVDFRGEQITTEQLKNVFKEAININSELVSNNKRVAYFYIDPLINSFEAANSFYFNILECKTVTKINTYKSGASPVQALADAKELIDNDLYDAVFVFGQDLIISNIKKYGKAEVKKAMNIFEEKSLIECYNSLAEQLCKELGLNRQQFIDISDRLFQNYFETYKRNTGINLIPNRGPILGDFNADLFRLTDCANPNIDFAGGIIITNQDTAQVLEILKEERVTVLSAKYAMVQAHPNNITNIVGNQNNIFSHLRKAFVDAQTLANIDVISEFYHGNLLLDVYTCYPPIPIAFLLASNLVNDISCLNEFLEQYPITITGGLNLIRAPWNNSALNSLIDIYKLMKKDKRQYGLVHANGGIGEVQGVTILQKLS